MEKEKLSVACVQLNSTDYVDENIDQIEQLTLFLHDIDLIALPECCLLRGPITKIKQFKGYHKYLEVLSKLAQKKNCYILIGSITEEEQGKYYNTSIVLDNSGNVVAKYRKIHLFEINGYDVDICEPHIFTPGDRGVVSSIYGWNCGLSICYDLRFPELFRDYAQNDLDLILMPSNFMEETGKAHWEVLCRARAIENQCYVLAPAQCGEIPHLKLESWGHSLILDPWGTIVSKAYRKPCVLKYQLDKKKIYAFRTKLPSLKNRAFNISLKLV